MNGQKTICLVLAVMMLFAQGAAALAHCLPVDGSPAHDHFSSARFAETRAFDNVFETSGANSERAHDDARSSQSQPSSEFDFQSPGSDCVLVSVVLAPHGVFDFDQTYVRLRLRTSGGTVPSAHMVALPTPPPDSAT